MRGVEGPYNLTINEELGLLVDGFDAPPMPLMGHDRPHVHRRLEELGYAKVKDVFAYTYDLGCDDPPPLQALLGRPPPAHIRLRMLDMSRYDDEIRMVTAIFNDAWSGNWRFTPLTDIETRSMAANLKPIIDKRLVWFAEIAGEVVGFVIGLANLNEAIADLGGRLFPVGWAKLLWRLKVRGVATARVPLMGVRRKFAGRMEGRMLPFLLIDALRRSGRALGYRRIELSWILEDNLPMRRIIEAIGARPYKTYRVYGKAL